eukprot:GHVS01052212.1.p1 GENE.GHVS01052212.1~~GHVS01052212.1.p1  ORF type:complete len:508 (-),score=79.39 GHVS01052212.1:538-2061(-)
MAPPTAFEDRSPRGRLVVNSLIGGGHRSGDECVAAGLIGRSGGTKRTAIVWVCVCICIASLYLIIQVGIQPIQFIKSSTSRASSVLSPTTTTTSLRQSATTVSDDIFSSAPTTSATITDLSVLSDILETRSREHREQLADLSNATQQLTNLVQQQGQTITAAAAITTEQQTELYRKTVYDTVEYMKKHYRLPADNNNNDDSSIMASNKSTSSTSPAQIGMAEDMALHIICHRGHWKHLPQVAESIRLQTFGQSELVIVLNTPEEEDPVDGGEQLDMESLRSLFVGDNNNNSKQHVRIFVRGGKISQGNNRQFASTKSKAGVLSFFDCDDYMHPQRNEILYKLFLKNPDLDLSLHRLDMIYVGNFRNSESVYSKEKLLARRFSQEIINNLKPSWDYNFVRSQLPTHNKTWNMNDIASEPNMDGSWIWWFPSEMKLPWSRTTDLEGFASDDIHNGWVTVRRSVFDKIKFPDSFMGEDSLFNWRAIRSGFNFTALNLKLGIYLKYDGVVD